MADMCRVFAIYTFFGLLIISQSSIAPRTSFLMGSPGRVLSQYHPPDVLNSTTLLLSSDEATLFVGASDAVLSLDVSQPEITQKAKFDWAPSKAPCHWETKKNCANFIRILQYINSTHLYVCGSHASSPHDIVLTADTLNNSSEPSQAKGRCPYNGNERNTALFVDSELYTATTKNYFGNEPIISRYLSKGRSNLELETTFTILKDPTFISSSHIPSERKVLFFFREVGAEYSFRQQLKVSRVAQVCTDDNGGERILQKRWTTFAKSELICRLENQLPFNLLQDIVMVPAANDESPDNTLFYGIFTSQWDLAYSRSAVCAFTLRDIKAAFSGDYLAYNMERNQWENQPNIDAKLGKCGAHDASDDTLNIVRKTFLTATSVHSLNHLISSREQLYSRITAQRVQAVNGQIYTVLYLLSETGFLHKVVLLKNEHHVIEEIQVFKQLQIMKTILLSASKGVIFIGSSEGVIRIPVSNCSFYANCAECVLARDPMCGWNMQENACVSVSDLKSNLRQDVENVNVTEQCEELARNNTLILKVVPVHFYQQIRLPCQASSRLAHISWRFFNNMVVPESLYQQHADGSLAFFVTPHTAKELHCVSEEQGFWQTLAIFNLSPHHSPRSQQPRLQTNEEMEQIPNLYLDSLDSNALFIHPKSYYNELVVVSIFFALCLCVLGVLAILFWRGNLRLLKQQPCL